MPPDRPPTPRPHLPKSQAAHALATPTSSQLLLTRLLHSQTPSYWIPPPTQLTQSQRDFLANGFSTLPPSIDPTGTPCTDPHNASRYTRKREHITAIIKHLLPLIPSEGHLLDACCGTGHVGLVLAYLLPTWTVTLVDRSSRALAIAKRRADDANLTNLVTFQGRIEEFSQTYNALVALHACGGASDACLASGVMNSAVACVIPCCTGGSVTSKGRVTGLSYDAKVVDPHPRAGFVDWTKAKSDQFRELLGVSEFEELARCADGVEVMGRVAKTLLEHDRVLWLRECGLECGMGKLGGGVKDDVIVLGDISQWSIDRVANGIVDDFMDDDADGVVRVLKDVVLRRGGIYRAGGGRVVRKRVHAAAELLDLKHYSVGRGKDRVVVVEKCDASDGQVYCRGIVGVRSTWIDEVGRKLCAMIPREFVERRVLVRGDEFHVTLFNSKEVRSIGNADEIVEITEQILRGTTVKVLGVGHVTNDGCGLRGWNNEAIGEGLVQEEAYFVVLDWPAVQVLRRRYGLGETDVHVTLGFRWEDVHGTRKNSATIVYKLEEESFEFR